MANPLLSVQAHLWLLTAMLAVILVANVLCNYWRSRDDRRYQKLKRLWETEKYSELLAFTSQLLQDRPASSLPLMFRAMALLGLNRLEEAKASATKFKDASPTMRNEAVGLLEAINERLSAEG